MKQDILTKFLLSQTSLRDALSFSEFSQLPEIGKLLASCEIENRETVLRLLYQALISDDAARRNQVQNAITEFSPGSQALEQEDQISDPSINAIFTQTLIQTLRSKTKALQQETQDALREIVQSVEALVDVTASTKLRRTGSDFELPPDTLKATSIAAQEISDLTGQFKRAKG